MRQEEETVNTVNIVLLPVEIHGKWTSDDCQGMPFRRTLPPSVPIDTFVTKIADICLSGAKRVNVAGTEHFSSLMWATTVNFTYLPTAEEQTTVIQDRVVSEVTAILTTQGHTPAQIKAHLSKLFFMTLQKYAEVENHPNELEEQETALCLNALEVIEDPCMRQTEPGLQEEG